MKKIFFPAFAALLIVATLSGCRKDIYGCTDPNATNYINNANVNNGSCLYYGNVMFWCAANFGTVTVTIQNQSGTITDVYTTGQPSGCGDAHSANFTLVQGNYNYTASAPASTQYPNGVSWNGTAQVVGNSCQLYELN
jgi:hypothetical protein